MLAQVCASAYLQPAGTPVQSEPRGTAAAAAAAGLGPSFKPGLRRYEGGTSRHGILRKGGQRVGGRREWGDGGG